MSVVKHAEAKDAVAFKNAIEEAIAGKVVTVLDALKVEVAGNFFNKVGETVAEEGGISGGVSRVWKKPKPPKVLIHTGRGGGGTLVHAGRSTTSHDTGEGSGASAPHGAGAQVPKHK